MNNARVCYSRTWVCTYNVSSVQCVYVYMCVCACSYVCIILALTRVKGLGTKVGCVHFIKHPTLLYVEVVWGQA